MVEETSAADSLSQKEERMDRFLHELVTLDGCVFALAAATVCVLALTVIASRSPVVRDGVPDWALVVGVPVVSLSFLAFVVGIAEAFPYAGRLFIRLRAATGWWWLRMAIGGVVAGVCGMALAVVSIPLYQALQPVLESAEISRWKQLGLLWTIAVCLYSCGHTVGMLLIVKCYELLNGCRDM